MPRKPRKLAPTTFRLTAEAEAIIKQILTDHPYLKNRTDAINFALQYAPRNNSAPRCPECGNALIAPRLSDGGTYGVWVCEEDSESALPLTVTSELVIAERQRLDKSDRAEKPSPRSRAGGH